MGVEEVDAVLADTDELDVFDVDEDPEFVEVEPLFEVELFVDGLLGVEVVLGVEG